MQNPIIQIIRIGPPIMYDMLINNIDINKIKNSSQLKYFFIRYTSKKVSELILLHEERNNNTIDKKNTRVTIYNIILNIFIS